MKRIPHARDVDKALKAVKSAAKSALQGLNRAAGAKMSAGDYSAAEALALKAKELQQFQIQIETLRMTWRALNRGAASKTGVTKATPLWSYYQPILKALSEAGGKSTPAEIEPQIEQLLSAQLQPGDHQAWLGGVNVGVSWFGEPANISSLRAGSKNVRTLSGKSQIKAVAQRKSRLRLSLETTESGLYSPTK